MFLKCGILLFSIQKFVQYSPKKSGFSSLQIIHKGKLLTLSYTAINEIATFTAVDENGRCNNNGI